MSDLRWGIMGCGNIAKTVAEDLRLVPGNRLTAVASATPGKAASFAATHGVPIALDDYAALARRDDVDVVYVATTHERHHANALLALRAGKAVLCEKPLCLNAMQARELHATAQQAGVFLMEAMWTRFIPAVVALQAEVQAGVIGPVRLLQADFGIAHDWKPDSRMVNKDLAGGALLDLGVYPLTFAQLIMGNPTLSESTARISTSVVDAQSSYLLSYLHGGQALLMSALDLTVPHQARIYGPLGRIIVDDFFHPTGYTVERHGEAARRVEHPFPGHGYQFEIAEVAACVREGRRDSRLRPMADTIAVMEVMDRIRAQWGLRYPQE